MPHADSSFVPETVKTKSEFWEYVHMQLVGLLDDQTSWVRYAITHTRSEHLYDISDHKSGECIVTRISFVDGF
jgi:hypothetical protein